MLEITELVTAGWEPTIRGMRNPLNSWDKSDTEFSRYVGAAPQIGPNDEGLMRRLLKAGTDDHCKFRRMIAVYCDIDAPLYWWKEFDTYKVGTVANSCSTMHTLMNEPFTADMFSNDGWATEHKGGRGDSYVEPIFQMDSTVRFLNDMRDLYFEAKEHGERDRAEHLWRRIVQTLPESWMQKRTVMMNYQVLANIYKSRRHHKLSEWRYFVRFMAENLPYSWIFTGEGL